MRHEFPAGSDLQVHADLRSGELVVEATDTTTATVTLRGSRADAVTVESRGERLEVVEHRRTGFLAGRGDLVVELRVPSGTELVAKVGSANVRATGALGPVRVATGAGDITLESVRGPATLKTGAGDITVASFEEEAQVKAGAGSIRVTRLTAPATFKTGAGSIEVTTAEAPVMLKSGSGDLVVGSTTQDATLTAATGELRVGRTTNGQLVLKNVSGDIRLGIPDGTPVWTDISTNTGRVQSTLTPTGAPVEGQDYVEVRARSLSGDIFLDRL